MPNDFPAPLTEGQLKTYFPLIRPPMGEGIFELGLVLGGTVSAGAYTGGVLDFLMEALDAWTRAKERGDPQAPTHDVVISTIGGASGGAINGAILTRAAGWSFPHGPHNNNPFYAAWTTGVDLMKLLSTAAEQGVTGFASLFNCSAIDAQAERTIAYSGGKLGQDGAPAHRSYLADPLRLIMMVGNVTGLPYRIKMAGETHLSHDLISHADFMRFALAVNGAPEASPAERPDELALESYSAQNWDRLRAAALATSAFPLAFRSRPLRRTLASCGYRVALIPGESGDAEVAQLIPRWDALVDGEPDANIVNFVNVDGGTVNNEPLDMVRIELAGWNGRNKRAGAEADRTVILIDPFSDPEMLGPRLPPGLLGLALPFIMSLVYQARFKPADIALAYADDVYSRFLIAPVGSGPDDARIEGKSAIAAGGLGGFLGFIDGSFLEYDYKLGRRNAYDFLSKHFVFPETHPLFGAKYWSDLQRRDQLVVDEMGARYLRMIPLMKDLPEPPKLSGAEWPRLKQFSADLHDAIEKRLDAVYELVRESNQQDSWWKRAIASTYLALGWKFAIRGTLRDKALEVIHTALQEQKLL